MAWTAGADVSTGDIIISATWNNYLGASGSLEYLKAIFDELNACSLSAELSGSRALDTEYQNGSKIRLVSVTINSDTGAKGYSQVAIGPASPPATYCGYVTCDDLNGDMKYQQLFFVVPPSYYYEVFDAGNSPNVYKWFEWDLF